MNPDNQTPPANVTEASDRLGSSDLLGRMLDDLARSLADDSEIFMACVRDIEATNSAAAVSAMLRAQQRAKDICSHFGHSPRDRMSGLHA